MATFAVMKASMILSAAVALLLCACSGTNGESGKATEDEPVRPRLRKEFPVGEDFYQITVIGAFDIEIREGPCSVVAEGDSMVVSTMRCEVADGGLTLSTRAEERLDMTPYGMVGGTRVEISLPELRILANCAGADIHAGTLHASRIHIGGMGTGPISIDTLLCGHFRYECSRETDGTFPCVRCDTAEVLTFGSGMTTVGIEARELAICDLSRGGGMVAQVAAPTVYINGSTSGTGTFDVDADELLVEWRGKGTGTLNGMAAHKEIIDLQRGTLTDNVRDKQ